MVRRLRRLLKDELGATAIEYAVMAGLIFGAIILAVTALGGATSDSFVDSGDMLSSALGP